MPQINTSDKPYLALTHQVTITAALCMLAELITKAYLSQLISCPDMLTVAAAALAAGLLCSPAGGCSSPAA
jgi:hypothetical protein